MKAKYIIMEYAICKLAKTPVNMLVFFGLLILFGCNKGNSGGVIEPPAPPVQETFSVKNIKKVFGFFGESRYSYCPSLVKEADGATQMFFCGTQNMIMVDNIYQIRLNSDGSQTDAKVVLTPGAAGTWDDHHTCDPSVIGGDFTMDGVHYQYALFYLTNAYGVYYNQIGVAFSNDLEAGSWVKYPYPLIKKTWDYAGDQMIGAQKAWGVGQPSAVSIDKKGKVLLIYTIGDVNGTRLVWVEMDLSDMDNYVEIAPTTMVKDGLFNLTYSATDVVNNADFAIDRTNDKIVMVRPIHPNLDQTYPTHIESAIEIAAMPLTEFLASKGKWMPMTRITPAVSGYPRNHNAAVERNVYGEIANWKNPMIYYTVSKAAPDVEPAGTSFAEWTYHIWRAEVTSND